MNVLLLLADSYKYSVEQEKKTQIQKSIIHYYSMDVNFEDNYKVFTVLKVRTGVPSTGR